MVIYVPYMRFPEGFEPSSRLISCGSKMSDIFFMRPPLSGCRLVPYRGIQMEHGRETQGRRIPFPSRSGQENFRAKFLGQGIPRLYTLETRRTAE